jgi:hypothetical protein
VKLGWALATASIGALALAIAARPDDESVGVVESITPKRAERAGAASEDAAPKHTWQRERLGPVTNDPFVAMQAPVVSKPKPAPPPPTAPAAPPAPVAPPFPYRVFGILTGPTDQRVTYLMRDNRLIAVEPGMELDGGYRIESVSEAAIVVVFVPLGQKTTLRIPEAAK